MKCIQPGLGFELWPQSPLPTTINITPQLFLWHAMSMQWLTTAAPVGLFDITSNSKTNQVSESQKIVQYLHHQVDQQDF